jgi:hypothetical protein
MTEQDRAAILERATVNILRVVETLIQIRETTGQILHLDIEPEPDGLLESGPEFIQWYQRYLIPLGVKHLTKHLEFTQRSAENAIKDHVQLCYDICHFAVGYEDHDDVIKQLDLNQIKVGKIQISAALKAEFRMNAEENAQVFNAFKNFNESTYLHQVVALQNNGELKRYPDLPEALNDAMHSTALAWRSHFHVPLFVKDYGVLQSTQEDIRHVLNIQKKNAFSNHLEIETYTWEVLPEKLKLPLVDSIVREIVWVKNALDE